MRTWFVDIPKVTPAIFTSHHSRNGLEKVTFRSVQWVGGTTGSGFQSAASRDLAWSTGHSTDPGHTLGVSR